MAIIKAQKLKHSFVQRDEEGKVIGENLALDGISLDVEPGQFIAILGHNGCGKSTLAKHLNALLTPTEGSLWVGGMDVSQEDLVWDIRQTAGMVFQNPDNQIIAGVVEEDVAFGLENIGVPTEDIWTKVAESLEMVGMTAYRYHSPNRLSGGQKQRVAIAGVVAMRPRCIIMDESTAMLDPNGRREVLKTVQLLNREENVTVIWITHHMEEVIDADKVFVMDQGKVVMEGTPREIFSMVEQLLEIGLDVPQITRLAYLLESDGYDLPAGILNRQELEDYLCRYAAIQEMMALNPDWVNENQEKTIASFEKEETEERVDSLEKNRRKKISLKDVNYVYSSGTAYERQALKDINLDIYEGEFVGIIGHTGSGKSTLIQLMDGLLKNTSGTIAFEDQDIYGQKYSLRQLRGRVGLVFQYPEYQLFETTVLKDVAYGPKNLGCTEEEAMERAREALRLVKLEERYWEMSPFELSGGQKRRVAIAGVISMNPEVLILDEPTASLDPRGRDELFALICELHRQMSLTILMITHSMEEVAEYVERIVVMNQGMIMLDGSPKEVFGHLEELEQISLAAPQVTYLMKELSERGVPVRSDITTLEEARAEIQANIYH